MALTFALLTACNSETARVEPLDALMHDQESTIIARYSSFSVARNATGRLLRIDRDGTIADADYLRRILLSRGIEHVAADAQRFTLVESGPAVRLVHRLGPAPAGFLEEMQRQGIEVIQYIPHGAYLVRTAQFAEASSGDLRSRLTILGFGYARDWTSTDKRAPSLENVAGLARVSLFVLPGEGALDVRRRIEREGAVLSQPVTVTTTTIIRADLDAMLLADLLNHPDVIWAEPYRAPEPADERQGVIMAGQLTDGLPTGPGYQAFVDALGLDLSGVVVDVTDTGCDSGDPAAIGHPDLTGRIVAIINHTTEASGHDSGGHGTINASIIGGAPPVSDDPSALDSLGYLYGLGVAPGVMIVCTKVMTSSYWDTSVAYTAMSAAASQAGAVISSNSWGMMTLGQSAYDAGAQEYDALVRDADRDVSNGLQPMIYIFAAGNEGAGGGWFGNAEALSSLRSPGTAKNVLTVGASENYRMTGAVDGCEVADAGSDNPMDLINFSSRGPTADFRLKPDVIAPGTHIQGAASTFSAYDGSSVCNGYEPSGQTRYTWSSGTSHATPGVAGVAALLYAWWKKTYGDVPSPAMVKAVFSLHTDDMFGGNNGFNTALEHIPSARQGWGRLTMRTMFAADGRIHDDQTHLFTATGQRYELNDLKPVDPSLPVKIALAWTDAPGPTMGAALVNNLDLEVMVNRTQRYPGNFIFDGRSLVWHEFDTTNNIELVILPAGVATRFSLSVIAANIAGDGVPGNGVAADQDFAIYLLNAVVAGPCQIDDDCNDHIDCTADVCQDGTCLSTPNDASCDDDEPCTDDACNASTGCVHTAQTGNACDDDIFCTVNDTCNDGVCAGSARNCSDGIDCTTDGCDESSGSCYYTPNDKLCDDGNAVTLDACLVAEGCQHSDGGLCDTPLTLTLPFTSQVNLTRRASVDSLSCSAAVTTSAPLVAYRFTSSVAGVLEAALATKGFSAELSLRNVCDGSAATCFSHANAADTSEAATISYDIVAGETYFIVVKGTANLGQGEASYTLTAKLQPVAIDGDQDSGEVTDADKGDLSLSDRDDEPTAKGSSGGGCQASPSGYSLLALLIAGWLLLPRRHRRLY